MKKGCNAELTVERVADHQKDCPFRKCGVCGFHEITGHSCTDVLRGWVRVLNNERKRMKTEILRLRRANGEDVNEETADGPVNVELNDMPLIE